MFPIDRSLVKRKTREADAKTKSARLDPQLFDQFKLKMWNMMDHLSEQQMYDLGQWIIAHDRVLKNQTGTENTRLYHRGEVVMVELGASNFKYEPSFEHPAVVLVNTWRDVLIAPASSKKYGKGFPDIIDATPADGGFTANSGIQMHAVRWVHKNRITVQHGRIRNAALLEAIDTYMLPWMPAIQAKITQLDADLEQRANQIKDQADEIAELKAKNRQLEEQREKAVHTAQLADIAFREIFRRHPELKKEFGEAVGDS